MPSYQRAASDGAGGIAYDSLDVTSRSCAWITGMDALDQYTGRAGCKAVRSAIHDFDRVLSDRETPDRDACFASTQIADSQNVRAVKERDVPIRDGSNRAHILDCGSQDDWLTESR